MKEKINIIIKVIFIIIILTTMLIGNKSYAADEEGGGGGGGTSIIDPNQYKPATDDDPNYAARSAVGKIIGTIRVVGTVVSVASLILIGIRFMLGSVESKAEYKKSMIPYVIGCVLIFAGSQLVQIIYDFANNL